jgi:alpha-L-fucosidase
MRIVTSVFALSAVLAIGVICDFVGRASAAPPVQIPAETPAEHDARMAWWREARFGMFIHWGLYAVPAGEWQGKPVPSIGEWIMNNADIPREEYEKLATQFNPVKYDAVAWAKAAKNAGIRYVVITSKHHDGFALFDSKVSDWDVVDRTPHKKDLLKPLADACRAEGIKFCCYHSIMDWHHPAQDKSADKNGKLHYNPTSMKDGRKAEYVTYMKGQLTELLDSCDPEILWFDGEWPGWWTEDDGRDLYAFLRAKKPSLIINNRVGKGRNGMQGLNKGDAEYVGDYGTPEQEIPATGLPGVDWESCMTMNDTWGFKKDDHNWKSTETLIRNLVDIASKGGNYLLNVGPTAEGEIPTASVERLAGIGKWMKVNGESIYGTSASPIGKPAWGRCTAKNVGGNTTLYLHVFDWPTDGKLRVPGVKGEAKSAQVLGGTETLQVVREGDDLVVTLPGKAADPIDTVVALTLGGEAAALK